jgi:sortase A
MTLRTQKVLIVTHYVLFISGIVALVYCAVVMLDAVHYQAWARAQLRNSNPELAPPAAPVTPGGHSALPPKSAKGEMALLGRIDVPRAHLSAMIAEGASSRVLRVAIGHITGTALPGQFGNIVLAAHRDSFFRHLGEVKPGDVIRITLPHGAYSYRVTFTDIVAPSETWVLLPASGESLTLITCYPFHYVGPAPKRFVVRAHRFDQN